MFRVSLQGYFHKLDLWSINQKLAFQWHLFKWVNMFYRGKYPKTKWSFFNSVSFCTQSTIENLPQGNLCKLNDTWKANASIQHLQEDIILKKQLFWWYICKEPNLTSSSAVTYHHMLHVCCYSHVINEFNTYSYRVKCLNQQKIFTWFGGVKNIIEAEKQDNKCPEIIALKDVFLWKQHLIIVPFPGQESFLL